MTLTACISAVSAVANATSFFAMSHSANMVLVLFIIWAIAALNIIGIRENARFTFLIFIFAAFVFFNLIASGVLSFDADSLVRLKAGIHHATTRLQTGSFLQGYGVFIASIASCILAYSGVESVLQTAGLVRTWREIGKAYIFLAVTVGLVTPVVAALALSADIDFARHEGDLITHYATLLNGVPFGVIVAALASLTLIMAVNTAFVASSELMERVAERYRFHWFIATNRRQSLYRIHLFNAIFFSLIIFITQGSQMILADMYALGLIASFCINMLSLLIYRYFMGTKEVIQFNTNRFITLGIWIVFMSCFFFLASMKPHGTMMWATVTGLVLVAGFLVAQKRGPEINEIEKTDSEMALILHLSQASTAHVHILFRRPREEILCVEGIKDNEAVCDVLFSPQRNSFEVGPERLSPAVAQAGAVLPLRLPPEPDRVRDARTRGHRAFRLAAVFMAGSVVHRGDDVQADATSTTFSPVQLRGGLPGCSEGIAGRDKGSGSVCPPEGRQRCLENPPEPETLAKRRRMSDIC